MEGNLNCQPLLTSLMMKHCDLDHLTGLHGYINKKKDGALTNDTEEKQKKKQGGGNVKNNFAGMNLKSAPSSITSNVISMFDVPVKVSYVGTNKPMSTYAMLDTCI